VTSDASWQRAALDAIISTEQGERESVFIAESIVRWDNG
jgi:hypothetical protein